MTDPKKPLTAEEPPEFVIGPALKMWEPGAADALMTWLLQQHGSMCEKGGVDCRTCDEAQAMGIERPC